MQDDNKFQSNSSIILESLENIPSPKNGPMTPIKFIQEIVVDHHQSNGSSSPTDPFAELSESLKSFSGILIEGNAFENETTYSDSKMCADHNNNGFRKIELTSCIGPLQDLEEEEEKTVKEFLERRRRKHGPKNNKEQMVEKFTKDMGAKYEAPFRTPVLNLCQSSETNFGKNKLALPFIPKKGKSKIELEVIPTSLFLPKL